MSRSVRKAIENAKHKKEHELRLTDEGIGDVATTYPELCKINVYVPCIKGGVFCAGAIIASYSECFITFVVIYPSWDLVKLVRFYALKNSCCVTLLV